MTNRRAFLFRAASLLAAPAVVKADSLMKLWVPKREVMIPYNPPMGFIPCDGREIHREMYADLFKVIGTTYGAGDGRTTFNIPNTKLPPALERSLFPNPHTHMKFEHIIVARGAPIHGHSLVGDFHAPVGSMFQRLAPA